MKHYLFLMPILWSVLVACNKSDAGKDDDGLIFNVPRLENTSGPSILDDPAADRGGSAGLCEKQQVYCNGQCLSDVGEQSGNCTLLQNNIGIAESIAVDETNLYYTAAASEILKMDLATLSPASLVTGLSSPSTLYATLGLLYFGNNPVSVSADKGAADAGPADIRVMKVGGSDVTVLTENIETAFEIFLSGDTLLFAAGGFGSGPLYSVPKTGGRWTEFGASEISHFEVSGNNAYFSIDTDTEAGIFTSFLSDTESYTQVTTGDAIANFFIEGNSLYWFASKAVNTARVYTSVPLSGGQKQEMQAAGSGILLSHNDVSTFYLDTDLSAGVNNIMMLPLQGGEASLLGTCEPNELQAAAADASHLYVTLGYSRTGGILRFDL